MRRKKGSGRIGAKIVIGAAGGILLGLGTKEILFDYVLPPELQTPLVMVVLGFVFLFITTKI